MGDQLLKSDLVVEGINYKQLAKYVAVNWSPGRVKIEGLDKITPRRRYTRGPKPQISGKESRSGRGFEDDPESQWKFPAKEPSEWEQKKLLAASVEIGILASFTNHIYCFGGRAFRQIRGGPIGSRLTMAVARIIMMVF